MIARSSISSSERNGNRAWYRPWLLGLALALLLAAGWEMLWRSRGHVPVVTDSQNLWAYQRGRVYGPDVLVLLGASRAQLGVDHAVFARHRPHARFVNLAVDHRDPTAILRDLASDPDFRGKLIVDAAPKSFTWGGIERASAYPYHYHRVFKRSLTSWADVAFGAWVQEHLAMRQANLRPLRLLQSLQYELRLPLPYYVRTFADRAREADYALAPASVQRRVALLRAEIETDPPVPTQQFEAVAGGPVREWVASIKRRGGDVVFVSFPTQGLQREHDERIAPKREFWDRIALLTGASTLHADDFAADFRLPDLSHLDVRDKRRFTEQLVKALEQIGFL
jgi:hypothetical protein